jgi:DNA-binding NtrC family response regulator
MQQSKAVGACPPRGRRRSRALVADDTRLIQWAIGGALEAEGFETATVSDRRELVDRLGRSSFDLVVASTTLGREDVSDLIDALCSRAPQTAVILLGEPEDPFVVHRCPGAVVFGKPFEVTEVVGTARRLLTERTGSARDETGGEEPPPDKA